MPANKSNVSTPRKEKSDGKLYTLTTSAAAAASRKKKRSLPFVKHKHYAQYLVSVSDELKRKTKKKEKKKKGKYIVIRIERPCTRRDAPRVHLLDADDPWNSDRSFRELPRRDPPSWNTWYFAWLRPPRCRTWGVKTLTL